MKKLIITIDTNDANYQTNYIKLEDDQFDKFLPILNVINGFKPYLYKFGVCYHNWPTGDQADERDGIKSPEELYCSDLITAKDLYDFECVFLNFDTPYGMHTIVKIEDVITDTIYVDGSHEHMKNMADTDPMIQEFYEEDQKFYNTITTSGKYIHCEQFSKLTPEELQMCKDHKMLWKRITEKYQNKEI